MPRQTISFTNFNRHLWVAGGRDQTPPDALRVAKGVAPELTSSIRSRLGSRLLYMHRGGAVSVYRYNGHDFYWDGASLFMDGGVIMTGGDGSGTPINFVTMPPHPGLPDYLFICGRGITPIKVSPGGVVSNWGIKPPRDGMQGLAGATDLLSIDTFISASGNWTPSAASVANSTGTPPPFGAAANCLEVTPSGAQQTNWYIVRTFGGVQNFAVYGDARISLTSDLISLRLWVQDATKLLWLALQFDVDDGSFTNYLFVNIQLVPASVSVGLAGGIQLVAQVDGSRWSLIQAPKSSFVRQGTKFNKSWDTIKAIKILGGLPYGGVGTVNIGLQNLQMTGSYALGQGAAALSGGSTYLGQVTFGNSTTGADSNPNLQPVIVEGVAEGPILWSNIPVSTDTQVSNRKLWRSSALQSGATSGPLFYVDTIQDNSTTTYTDTFADSATPLTNTIWLASATYISGQLIDGGNGWAFQCTTPGTSGGSQPLWSAPGGYWIGLFSQWTAGDLIFDPISGFVLRAGNTGGTTGVSRPNFGTLSINSFLIDGGQTWTRIALPTTTDGTIVWTFFGINSTLVLGTQQVLLDNAPPPTTIQDAAGPWQGSMAMSRDSNPGFMGAVYISPPGRPEAVGIQINPASDQDPAQKLTVWDTALWLHTTQKIKQIVGTYPAISWNDVDGSSGTTDPFTVVSMRKIGIVYAGQDGIRKFNYGGVDFIGFDALAPILAGGLGSEGMANFDPSRAFETPFGEVMFSDTGNRLTLALSMEQDGSSPSWRDPGVFIYAGYFQRDTGTVLASFYDGIYNYESRSGPDDTVAIPFAIQSPGSFQPSAKFTTQRLYITANLNGQLLTPTLIVDGVSYTLPDLVGTARMTYELPKQVEGRLFDGIALAGSLTAQVEVFRIEADIWYGETSSYPQAIEKSAEQELAQQ